MQCGPLQLQILTDWTADFLPLVQVKNQQTSHHTKMGTEVTRDGNSHMSEHLVWKWDVIRKAPSDPKWIAFQELEGT